MSKAWRTAVASSIVIGTMLAAYGLDDLHLVRMAAPEYVIAFFVAMIGVIKFLEATAPKPPTPPGRQKDIADR